MKPLPPSVRVQLALPRSDYAAYLETVRHLSRKMGHRAPSVRELITHTLRCRDALGLAEDYLESIGWEELVPEKPRGIRRRRNPDEMGKGPWPFLPGDLS